MAKKSFEIQGSTLRIGGLDLQAGASSIVIPGVTQATTYTVEEVKDIDTQQEITFETAPQIIDIVIFNDYVANGSTALRAEYVAELDDDGTIDDIEVINGGTYSVQEYNDIVGATSLLAYAGVETDPFAIFNQADWTSIPFRVKMKAGEIENVGGGNSNTGDITFEDNMIIGAGEDSGDGNGYNTIRLVPDYSLGENGQYIVIDPTAPNHIHIRAGGEQDNSNAILFLGGEKNNVSIEDGNGVTISNEQTFDSYNYYSAGSDFTDFTWFEENGNYFVQFTTVTAPMVSDFWNFTNGTPNALRVYDSQGQYTLTYGGPGSNTVANVYKLQVVEAPIVDFVATALEFQIFTTNYNEMYLRNNDFRVDVKDDVRIIGSDVFRLANRSADEPIEITTNDDNTSNTWSFGSNGVLTLPSGGDIKDANNDSVLGKILNTVTLAGSNTPATGDVATVTLSPTNNTNFAPGTYPGIFIGLNAGFSITLVVAENGDLSATIISSNGGFTVGDSGGINGAAITGGTTAVDDITITVASLTNIAYPSELDLTKQVQKLTGGWYTLNDGVEGQIMHLVASDQLLDANSVRVVVANARIGSNVGTDYWLYPFNGYNGGIHGFSTVIFVDGAWQANGGAWD